MLKLLCVLIFFIATVSAGFKVKIRYDDEDGIKKKDLDVFIWPIAHEIPPPQSKYSIKWMDDNPLSIMSEQGWYYVQVKQFTRKIYFGSKLTYLFTDGFFFGYF